MFYFRYAKEIDYRSNIGARYVINCVVSERTGEVFFFRHITGQGYVKINQQHLSEWKKELRRKIQDTASTYFQQEFTLLKLF